MISFYLTVLSTFKPNDAINFLYSRPFRYWFHRSPGFIFLEIVTKTIRPAPYIHAKGRKKINRFAAGQCAIPCWSKYLNASTGFCKRRKFFA